VEAESREEEGKDVLKNLDFFLVLLLACACVCNMFVKTMNNNKEMA